MLVVSPLLALMRDQLAHLPAGLPAAMLASDQPRSEARQVLSDLRVCCVLLCESTGGLRPLGAAPLSGWLAAPVRPAPFCAALVM